ncbi:MAG: sugar ABC transporter ATP-binding protein [Candidatus Marinimicrobia bacterium]|jgi:simple sugar transport system ATP-binding protein|nr:sugar ABC transporter ATP-binding protein [Candidatus Neomarinimicrobiota bacterium]MBT6471701.1 sugar ABC transporter ATP-binding protein [Candidatus Neomarinimicrobiota bacterium]MBT7014526.1 sugar ABC transporter ATP-binding protein [Actinomycetota bacterium]
MEEKVVEMRNIYKKFGNVNALNGVDLSLNKGEVLGLVGDNAAGKSTLCKILSGAYRPTSGGIIINNCEVNFDSPADAKNNHIEMVYQDLSLCNSIDVAGNLFLGREMHKYIFGLKLLDKNRMHSSSAKILKDLSIKVPSTKIKVEYLSGGQRQSIAIGKAVSFDPKVLIMDEPTSALAVAEVKAVLELIKTVSFKGVSVIFITHRLQDIFKVCDRVMVMYEGRKVADKLINETTLQDLVELIVSEH